MFGAHLFDGFIKHLEEVGFSGCWKDLPEDSTKQFFSTFPKTFFCLTIDVRESPIAVKLIKEIGDTFEYASYPFIRLPQRFHCLVALAIHLRQFHFIEACVA